MEISSREYLAPGVRTALAALRKSLVCAEDLRIDPWDFALRSAHLFEMGVEESSLRWLALRGYVTIRDRTENSSMDANADSDPCFLLTDAGRLLADKCVVELSASDRSTSIVATLPLRPQVPCWDRRLRELSFAGRLVKRFRLRSKNQEDVLAAFQAENWPPSINDPLPFLPRSRAEERLHATIRCLNANHLNRLICFHGGDAGESVLWEQVATLASSRSFRKSRLRRAA